MLVLQSQFSNSSPLLSFIAADDSVKHGFLKWNRRAALTVKLLTWIISSRVHGFDPSDRPLIEKLLFQLLSTNSKNFWFFEINYLWAKLVRTSEDKKKSRNFHSEKSPGVKEIVLFCSLFHSFMFQRFEKGKKKLSHYEREKINECIPTWMANTQSSSRVSCRQRQEKGPRTCPMRITDLRVSYGSIKEGWYLDI